MIVVIYQGIAFGSYRGIDLRTGESINFKEDREKPVVAIFLSSTCPCSKASFSYLSALSEKYSNIQFIGFNSNKNTNIEKAKKYYQGFNIQFPIILDRDLTYANQFKALKTPHIFVKNNEKIVYQGGVTNRRNPELATSFFLNDALEATTLNKKIATPETKALGCFIQR